MARRGREPGRFDLGAVARLAHGFSVAEIEQAVVSALYDAFAEGRELEQGHLEHAVKETFRLASTMREEIERVREWARTRTRPASAVPAEEVPRPIDARFGSL